MGPRTLQTGDGSERWERGVMSSTAGVCRVLAEEEERSSWNREERNL